MARRKAQVAWSTTPAGLAAYEVARAEAQKKANATGFDYGLRCNDIFKSWDSFMLPGKAFRYGHERACEVVMCESIEKCQPGHGPMAREH